MDRVMVMALPTSLGVIIIIFINDAYFILDLHLYTFSVILLLYYFLTCDYGIFKMSWIIKMTSLAGVFISFTFSIGATSRDRTDADPTQIWSSPKIKVLLEHLTHTNIQYESSRVPPELLLTLMELVSSRLE